LDDYWVRLLMPGDSKSVESRAAIAAPAQVSAKHQSLLHLVGQAPWLERPFCKRSMSWFRVSAMTPFLRRRARIRSASHANIAAGSANRTIVKSRGEPGDRLPAYLLEAWANGAAKRRVCGYQFRTKPQAALDQIRVDHVAGVVPGRVLADGGVASDSG
jgi:SRSO17 transposase